MEKRKNEGLKQKRRLDEKETNIENAKRKWRKKEVQNERKGEDNIWIMLSLFISPFPSGLSLTLYTIS